MSEPSIAEVLPAEYAAYEQTLAGDGGLNDARVSLALLAKSREALERSSVDDNNPDQESINAYYAVWRLCLRMVQNSNDEAARQLILDEWNKSLQEDSDITPL